MENNNFIQLNEKVCINKNFIIKFILEDFPAAKKYEITLCLSDGRKYELTFKSELDRDCFISKHLNFTIEHVPIDYRLEIYYSK